MFVEYTWILWQEKIFRQFRLQYPLAFIGRAVGVEGMGEIIIFARYKVHFNIKHENMLKDPSNNKSIPEIDKSIVKQGLQLPLKKLRTNRSRHAYIQTLIIEKLRFYR